MSSDVSNNRPEDHVHPDRLLPLGELSPRQQAVSYLLRMGLPAPVCNALDSVLISILRKAVEEYAIAHASDNKQDQHWLQAYGDKITRVDLNESATPLFHMDCSRCGKDAVFTAEGPNDEYPEPLCEKCEEGDDLGDAHVEDMEGADK